MSPQILTAVLWAEKAHRGQPRKYTGEPYIVHPLEVAELVASAGFNDDAIITALLHDTVEDCGVTLDQIAEVFGDRVANYVSEVTDISKPENGPRLVRKELDRLHYATASYVGKSIKLADLICNAPSIIAHGKGFAHVFIREMRALLTVLDKGHPTLWITASHIVEDFEKNNVPF